MATDLQAISMMGKTARTRGEPAFTDHLALWLLRLAKWRRRVLRSAEPKDYGEFYEEFFESKDIVAYQEDERMEVRRATIAHYFRTHVPAGAGVLDVGCGLGDVLAGFPDGYRLLGVDYANSNVQRARQRLGERALLKQGSIYELPWNDNEIDACICLEVLEHIEDDERGLREIARVLKPGGFLLASVPYTYYWPDYQRLMGHFRHYTRESFAAMMTAVGLIPRDYLPNFPNWHQAYTRRYALIRAESVLVGPLLGRKPLYEFKWPWQSQFALTVLARRLEPLRRKDGKLDYARLPTSTFIAAYKPAP